MRKASEITIYTDSWYIMNGIEDRARWEQCGWKNAKGKEVANVDLWQQIQDLTQNHTVTVKIGEQHSYRNWLKDELHRCNNGGTYV